MKIKKEDLHVVGAVPTQGYFEHQQRREFLKLHVVGAAPTQGYFEHQQRREK